MTRYFWVVDEAMKARGAIFAKKHETQEGAEKAARKAWAHMTSAEKDGREAFYIVYGPANPEDAESPDFNNLYTAETYK